MLLDFDRFFGELLDFCERTNHELPRLLEAEINHKCFTFFHKEKKDDPELAKRDAAKQFVEHLVQTDYLSVLRAKKFRNEEGNTYHSLITKLS